ncbi:hypothetical protein A7K99_01735 [Tatumella citrea]|uniref:Uncharacterized protein n=1 Tax=Tatumella citrea TaxID=53336 RepID=A0A1Y0LG77_TATCI|nr:hypothetical protein A7K98_01735 [Tatumella citrea]ARU96659.1 hypothetical protein A7K99_01735 [Tatumella citrea]
MKNGPAPASICSLLHSLLRNMPGQPVVSATDNRHCTQTLLPVKQIPLHRLTHSTENSHAGSHQGLNQTDVHIYEPGSQI